MEPKKNEKANLENKKTLFIQVGLIIALLVCLGAMEWTSGQKKDSAFAGMTEPSRDGRTLARTSPRGMAEPERDDGTVAGTTELRPIQRLSGTFNSLCAISSIDTSRKVSTLALFTKRAGRYMSQTQASPMDTS